MALTGPYIHRRPTNAGTIVSGIKEMEGVGERRHGMEVSL